MASGESNQNSSSSSVSSRSLPNQLDEQTPLLRSTSRRSFIGDEASRREAILEAVALVDGPGLEPGHPGELSKIRSYSSSKAVDDLDEEQPDSDDGRTIESISRDESPYLAGVSRKRFWVIFIGILIQYFVACFDSTMMASSHPVITSHFKSSNSASWLSTAFLVTYSSFQPLYSRVSDTIGRRPLYFFSLTVFALTTLWCALAPSMGSLIAARAFCGLGAGGMIAMGAILTNDMVPIHVRGFYQALINLFFGTGAACGAAFGGFLCDTLGWRWTFGVQLPFILFIFVLAILATPKNLGPELAKNSSKSGWEIVRGFDLAGSFLLTFAAALLILGLNLGGNVLPWSHPFVIVAIVVSIVASVILVFVEKRAEKPVMPLKLLASAPRGNIVFHNFLTLLGSNAVVFNAPLYFQAVHLDSPSTSGFRLAAPSFGITICGVASGMIMTATGRPKPLIVIGSLVSLAGGIAMAALPHHANIVGVTVAAFLPTTGTGISFPASAISNLAFSSKEDQAVMSTTSILWRSMGTVMGVALSSLLVQNALPGYLDKYVQGSDREVIIQRVRKSVHAIFELDPIHQAQVQRAYEESLRFAFILSVVTFVAAFCLVFPVRIGQLERKKPAQKPTETTSRPLSSSGTQRV